VSGRAPILQVAGKKGQTGKGRRERDRLIAPPFEMTWRCAGFLIWGDAHVGRVAARCGAWGRQVVLCVVNECKRLWLFSPFIVGNVDASPLDGVDSATGAPRRSPLKMGEAMDFKRVAAAGMTIALTLAFSSGSVALDWIVKHSKTDLP
jgi:hypothetical protein